MTAHYAARFDLGWLSCAGHCDRFLEDANPDVISALAERSIVRFTVAELSKVSLGFCPAEMLSHSFPILIHASDKVRDR